MSCTNDEMRVIGAENMIHMQTLLYAAHSIHPGMRSHTNGGIKF